MINLFLTKVKKLIVPVYAWQYNCKLLYFNAIVIFGCISYDSSWIRKNLFLDAYSNAKEEIRYERYNMGKIIEEFVSEAKGT